MKAKILSFIMIISLIAAFVPGVYATDIKTDGLIGYWSFDDETTEAVQSEVNPDSWGTPFVGSQIEAGKEGMVGNSFQFVKTSNHGDPENYINIGMPQQIKDSKTFTFSGWVNLKGSYSNSAIVSLSHVDHTAQPMLMLYFEGRKLRGLSDNKNAMSIEQTLEAGKWYYITATFDVTEKKHSMDAYVDGVRVGGRSISNRTFDLAANEIWVGGAGALSGETKLYESFNGWMDDIRIYARVLSAAEIEQLYNSYKVNVAATKNEIKMYSYNQISSDNYIDIEITDDEFADNLDKTMFTTEGLPEGMAIDSVESIDATHARLYISGTPTEDIVDDVTFTIKAASVAGKMSCLDGDAFECIIKKPDDFVIEAEATQSGNSIELSGKVINTWNVPQSAVALIGVYDGTMLKNQIITEIENLDKDLYIDLTQSIDVTGYENPNISIYLWDALPEANSDDEDIAVTGGIILAKSYSYPDAVQEAGNTDNTDITIDTNSNEETVTISGAAAGEKAAIMVYVTDENGSRVDHFKEVPVSENNKISYIYKLHNPANDVPYNVFVIDNNGGVMKEFKYYSATYRETVLSNAKGKSGQEFIDYVTSQQYVLDIDLSSEGAYGQLTLQAQTDFWVELQKGIASCENHLAFKEFFTKTTQKMTITDDINNAATAADIITVLAAEYAQIGINLNADYETYKQTIAEKMLTPVYHNIIELKTGFENILYTTVFNAIDSTDRTKMLEKLTEYKTELGISEAFFGEKKDTYVKYMMGITFTDKADIKTKSDTAISRGDASQNNITQNVGTQGGTVSGGVVGNRPSTGGGGGGGGTSTSPVQMFDNTTIKEPVITAEQANAAFGDLDSVEWAKEAIEALAAKGVLSGKAEKVFAPNDRVTRAELAKMIVLAFGTYNESMTTESFSDVTAEDWFYPYIANAEDREVITGKGDGTFGVNEIVTREDLCVMIYRQLNTEGKVSEATDAQFADQDKISDYAKEAVSKMKAAGVVNGVDESNFAPKNSCTRAMAAKVIYAAMNLQ